jgi:RES domain-containing protein
LDLTGEGLADVGLEISDIRGDDWGPCQLVGEGAHFLGAAGLVAPSATGLGLTIAVFETRVRGQLAIVDADEIFSSEAEKSHG